LDVKKFRGGQGKRREEGEGEERRGGEGRSRRPPFRKLSAPGEHLYFKNVPGVTPSDF